MRNNVFINNFAGNEGGCLKYTNGATIFKNNTFINNFAYYGNNVAGFITNALILNITSSDEWDLKYAGDLNNIYIENFCTFPQNSTYCAREKFNYLDLTTKKELISKFTINVNKSQSFPGKIVVLLLDDFYQIVTTQNAIGQMDRYQILNLTFFENVYSLGQNVNNKNGSILSRLQVFTAKTGIITINNFQVDYDPGANLF